MKALSDVASIGEADKHMLLDVKHAIMELVPSADLLLYGSTVRGERSPESDYDILVLTDQVLAASFQDVLRGVVYDIALDHDVVISLAFVSKDYWRLPFVCVTPFHKNVESEGLAL